MHVVTRVTIFKYILSDFLTFVWDTGKEHCKRHFQQLCFPTIRTRSITYLFLIKDNISEKISKHSILPIGILQASETFIPF